ncbi:hypothetical protein NKH18_34720 [Streptomyces sp. M10(2022)]
MVLLNGLSYLAMLTALLLIRPAQLHVRPRRPGVRPGCAAPGSTCGTTPASRSCCSS